MNKIEYFYDFNNSSEEESIKKINYFKSKHKPLFDISYYDKIEAEEKIIVKDDIEIEEEKFVEIRNLKKDCDIELDIILGYLCNYNCSYCFESNKKNISDLLNWNKTFETIKNNKEFLFNKKINIVFIGGETSLFRCDKIIDDIYSLGITVNKISYITNGSFETNIEKFINKCIEKNIECVISFSFHEEFVDIDFFNKKIERIKNKFNIEIDKTFVLNSKNNDYYLQNKEKMNDFIISIDKFNSENNNNIIIDYLQNIYSMVYSGYIKLKTDKSEYYILENNPTQINKIFNFEIRNKKCYTKKYRIYKENFEYFCDFIKDEKCNADFCSCFNCEYLME